MKATGNPMALKSEVQIFKLFGTSQYIVRSSGNEALFIQEADAQRYARHLHGATQDVRVEVMPKEPLFKADRSQQSPF
jgi:hypothetical protein